MAKLFMKQSVVFAILFAGALTASAEDEVVSGIHEYSSVKDVSDPYVAGWDTFRYTGSSAELTKAFKIAANDGSALHATTIDIADQNAELTLSNVDYNNKGGALVKTGLGTLVLKKLGSLSQGGEIGAYWDATPPLRWDDGKAYDCYPSFVVDHGKVVIDKTGETLTIPNSVVGLIRKDSDNDIPACLEIVNGTVNVGNSLTVDRGDGTTEHHPLNSVYVRANGVLTGNNLWMNAVNGRGSGYYGNSLLEVDGGKVSIANQLRLGMQRGDNVINIKNSGLLEETTSVFPSTESYSAHLPLSASVDKFALTVDNCSTGSFYTVNTQRADEKSVITVSGDSVLKVDRYHTPSLLSRTGGGVMAFDKATLCSVRSRVSSEWFPYCEAYSVGTGGLTLFTDILSSLGGTSRAPKTGQIGTITKTGAGTISLHPGEANVSLEQGGIRLTTSPTPVLVPESSQNGVITASSGTFIEAVGHRALGRMTVIAGDQKVGFKKPGLENLAFVDGWSFAGRAVPRADGWINLSEGSANNDGVGAAWYKTKVDVSRSFTLTADYYTYKHADKPSTTGESPYYPYGISIVWQNTASGLEKTGTGQRGMGFCSEKNPWENSFAVGFDVAGSGVKHSRRYADGDNAGKSYFKTGSDHIDQSTAVLGGATAVDPYRMKVVYDAQNKKMVFEIARNNAVTSYQIADTVNLENACGNNLAWFGFTGCSPSSSSVGNGESFVGNVRLSYAAEEREQDIVHVGGTIRIADGKTFKAAVDTESAKTVWKVDRLSYAAGGTIQVSGAKEGVALGVESSDVTGTGYLRKTGDGAFALNPSYPLEGNLEIVEGSLMRYGESVQFSEGAWTLSTPAAGSKPVTSAVFLDGTIVVGRSNNNAFLCDDTANYNRRIKVNCPWEISYDLEVTRTDVAASYGYYAIYFHNDSRGTSAFGGIKNGLDVGMDYGQANPPDVVRGVENAAIVLWTGAGGQGTYNVGNRVAVLSQSPTVPFANLNSTSISPVNMGPSGQNRETSSKVCHVTLNYDPNEKKLTLRMDQDGVQSFVHEFDIDIAEAVGKQDFAYLAFAAGTAQNYFNICQTVSNFKYRGGEFEGVVVEDCLVRGDLKISQTGRSTSIKTGEGETVLANTLTVADGATLSLDGKVAVKSTVSCDGMMTVDGGTFAVADAKALDGVKKLNLTGDAKLYVPEDVTISRGGIYKNGEFVGAGTYTGDFVTGGGSVQVVDMVVTDDKITYYPGMDLNLANSPLTIGNSYTLDNTDNNAVFKWTDDATGDGKIGVMTSEGKFKVVAGTPANGLTSWQSAVLGLNPTVATSKPIVTAPQNAEPNLVKVDFGKNVIDLTKNAALLGVTPKFTLKEAKNPNLTGATSGEKQEGTSFDIALGGTDEPGVRYFRVDADIAGETVQGENVMGLMKVTSPVSDMLFAVPWVKLSGAAEDINVENIVKTAGLTAESTEAAADGDKLFVYNANEDYYDVWTLKLKEGVKRWVWVESSYKIDSTGNLIKKTPADPLVTTVQRGSYFRLKREDTNNPVYLYGQYTTAAPAWTTVTKGETVVLASPKAEPLAFSTITNPQTGVSEDDQFVLPSNSSVGGAQTTVKYVNGKWGFWKTTVVGNVVKSVFSVVSEIPMGTGFWYIKKGESDSTFSWE